MTTDNKALADRLRMHASDCFKAADRDTDVVLMPLQLDDMSKALEEAAAALTATPSAQAGEVPGFIRESLAMIPPDDFRNDNFHLIACIEALLSLDKAGAIVPHGVGGHARGLLASAAHRLAKLTAAPQPQGDASLRDFTEEIGTNGKPTGYFLFGQQPALTPRAHEPAPQPVNPAPVSSKSTVEPAPTADGGAEWWCSTCQSVVAPADVTFSEHHDTRAGGCGGPVGERTHPAPAPDVSRLVEAAREVADEHMGLAATTIYHGDDDEVGMRACCDVRSYDPHKPDCPAVKLREALRPFTAAQPKEEG